jgi:NAD(P) transhydrogenase subunit alpha
MIIGVPRETVSGETRIAVVPGVVSQLARDKHDVLVERGAGHAAHVSDEELKAAGAAIAASAGDVYAKADIVFKVQPPVEEADRLREGSSLIGFLAPLANPGTIRTLARRRITAFSMEYVPRISRAQSMDALSSMATIAGYKAVMIGAHELGKMFPLMMTAAGTIPPATVFVLGAGVAGLQAIATAKRLGAKVEAFDPRPAVKEQVKSLGATFVEMEMPADAETEGGYARELSPEFIRKEMEAIAARLPKTSLLVTTAQVFGKRAPVLITEEMVKLMHPGSVIVDIAAEQGGNCVLTEPGKTVTRHGVVIAGPTNLAATVPVDASQMYARNIVTLFKHLYPKADALPDFADEIAAGCCITRGGEVVHPAVKASIG